MTFINAIRLKLLELSSDDGAFPTRYPFDSVVFGDLDSASMLGIVVLLAVVFREYIVPTLLCCISVRG